MENGVGGAGVGWKYGVSVCIRPAHTSRAWLNRIGIRDRSMVRIGKQFAVAQFGKGRNQLVKLVGLATFVFHSLRVRPRLIRREGKCRSERGGSRKNRKVRRGMEVQARRTAEEHRYRDMRALDSVFAPEKTLLAGLDGRFRGLGARDCGVDLGATLSNWVGDAWPGPKKRVAGGTQCDVVERAHGRDQDNWARDDIVSEDTEPEDPLERVRAFDERKIKAEPWISSAEDVRTILPLLIEMDVGVFGQFRRMAAGQDCARIRPHQIVDDVKPFPTSSSRFNVFAKLIVYRPGTATREPYYSKLDIPILYYGWQGEKDATKLFRG
ncbi:hypothetical protein B0H13DRAFT_1922903 [Mycena leptocephala]|nr:hypothetical protein B0H13DRAFT_1922903 [Mycena leptocephala]